jgi:hypothetical protein
MTANSAAHDDCIRDAAATRPAVEERLRCLLEQGYWQKWRACIAVGPCSETLATDCSRMVSATDPCSAIAWSDDDSRAFLGCGP